MKQAFLIFICLIVIRLIFISLSAQNGNKKNPDRKVPSGILYERFYIEKEKVNDIDNSSFNQYPSITMLIPEIFTKKKNTEYDFAEKKDINTIKKIGLSDFLAGIYLINNKYNHAIKLYTEVIEEAPSAERYLNRGICHYHIFDYKSAIDDFKKAMESKDCDEKMKEKCMEYIKEIGL